MEGQTYTTILHGPRTKLKLTVAEYCLADYIHRIGKPVCRVDEGDIGKALGMSRATVYRLVPILEEAGLVERVEGGIQSTERWYEEVEERRLNMRNTSSQHKTKNLIVRRPSIDNKETYKEKEITAPPFSLDVEIKKLDDSPRRDLNIISFYLEKRKPDIRNAAQFSQAVKRHVRAANALKVFDDEQIVGAAKKAKAMTDEWTLETILKILTK